ELLQRLLERFRHRICEVKSMNAHRWKVWVSVCGTSLLLLVVAGARGQSTPAKASSEDAAAKPPKLAEEEYKNIQALKGIPAEQVVKKYISAIGGAAALQKVTSRVEKGTLTAFGGQHFPVDVYSKAPDKRLSIMHLPNGDSVTAFDGQRGWLSVPGRVHRMS